MPKRLSPAERVARLRGSLSHDRFAVLVEEKARELGYTNLKPKRQRIIGWEGGAGIGADYSFVLAAMDGSNPEAFRPSRPMNEYRSIRRELREIRDDLADIRRVLEAAGLTT